jgi:uncharacterized alkaline shock family protein YloU
MKKLFKKIFIVLAVLLMATEALANGIVGNTGDALIATGRGYFKGIIVHSDGTNSVTVDIYDNTTAAGTKLVSSTIFTTSASNRTGVLGFSDQEAPFTNGIYVDVTTSGTVTYDVYIDPR